MLRTDFSNCIFSEDEKSALLSGFPQGMVVFDMEMTGLSPLFDDIIEIAAIRVLPDASIQSFHSFVCPRSEISAESFAIHGIKQCDLVGEKPIEDVLQEFFKFCGTAPLLAYNAQFDVSYLVKALLDHGANFPNLEVYDAYIAVKKGLKNSQERPQNLKLTSLAKLFAFNYDPHQAKDDAYICLKVFIQFLKRASNLEAFRKETFLFKMRSFTDKADYQLPSQFELLPNSIKEKRPIEIIYKGGTKGRDWRKIQPISVMIMPQGLVLYGKCFLSDYNKYFYLKKIKEFRLSKADTL